MFYTLMIIMILHFVFYYMNIDIIQLYNKFKYQFKYPLKDPFKDPMENNDSIINELETSLKLLKEINNNYT